MQPVSQQELDIYLRTIAKQIVAIEPELIAQPEMVDQVVADVGQLLRFKARHYSHQLTKEKILQIDFLRKLTHTMIAEIVLYGFSEQREFLENLDRAIHINKLVYHVELRHALTEEEALLKDIEELMLQLTQLMNIDDSRAEHFQEKLRHKLLKRLHRRLLHKLDQLLSLTLNPKSKLALREALRKLLHRMRMLYAKLNKNKKASAHILPVHEDIYINLFGLLNSYMTGSIAVPLSQYLGNGLGFNDWNPNHGYANIDKVNQLNFRFGDPLGMEHTTLRHYFAIEDDFVKTLLSLLSSQGLSVSLNCEDSLDNI